MVKNYALEEFCSITDGFLKSPDTSCPEFRYLCAMVAELSYYHIPEWEIDGKKRAKVIPCKKYYTLCLSGHQINITRIFSLYEPLRGFAVADRGVVAVGLVYKNALFIGFRGTQFLYDWRVNLSTTLTPIEASRVSIAYAEKTSVNHIHSVKHIHLYGRLHRGFSEESIRISWRIMNEIKEQNITDINHVFLSGHSLGGAIAAIADNLIHVAQNAVCILGAPRYSDVSAYFSLAKEPPTQIRRPEDIVPTLPPRFLGYADHPIEVKTDGAVYIDPRSYASTFGSFLRWARFLAGCFEPHSIEVYRNELGLAADAKGALLPLTAIDKLTS